MYEVGLCQQQLKLILSNVGALITQQCATFVLVRHSFVKLDDTCYHKVLICQIKHNLRSPPPKVCTSIIDAPLK